MSTSYLGPLGGWPHQGLFPFPLPLPRCHSCHLLSRNLFWGRWGSLHGYRMLLRRARRRDHRSGERLRSGRDVGELSALLACEQLGVYFGQHPARGYRHVVQQFVELLVVGHGQQDVSRGDATLLVVTRSITRQLQDLSCKKLNMRRIEDCMYIQQLWVCIFNN